LLLLLFRWGFATTSLGVVSIWWCWFISHRWMLGVERDTMNVEFSLVSFFFVLHPNVIIDT
jgi:hypothetical protein